MTKRERLALRKSIAEGVRQAARDLLYGEDGEKLVSGEWHDGDSRTWRGPEVDEECQSAWSHLVHAMREWEERRDVPDKLTLTPDQLAEGRRLLLLTREKGAQIEDFHAYERWLEPVEDALFAMAEECKGAKAERDAAREQLQTWLADKPLATAVARASAAEAEVARLREELRRRA